MPLDLWEESLGMAGHLFLNKNYLLWMSELALIHGGESCQVGMQAWAADHRANEEPRILWEICQHNGIKS